MIGIVELHPFTRIASALPVDLELKPGFWVVIQDYEGEELGRLVGYKEIDETSAVIKRVAGEADLARRIRLKESANRALEVARILTQELKLAMNLVDAHLRFDGRKICFYFTAPERVDFRVFHRRIAERLGIRVAIRQIGARDYARFLGGLGPCGRPLCCTTFLEDLRQITLRMARTQNLFVESTKLTGCCGKLLCCLGFEYSIYEEALRSFPRVGSIVSAPQFSGKARVEGCDIFNRKVLLKYQDGTELYIPLEEIQDEDYEHSSEEDKTEI